MDWDDIFESILDKIAECRDRESHTASTKEVQAADLGSRADLTDETRRQIGELNIIAERRRYAAQRLQDALIECQRLYDNALRDLQQ